MINFQTILHAFNIEEIKNGSVPGTSGGSGGMGTLGAGGEDGQATAIVQTEKLQ